VDTAAEDHDALRRLLDQYLHTAYAADRIHSPQRLPIDPVTAGSGATTVDIADYPAAMARFTAEHPALLAAIERAAATGFDGHAWQLAWTLVSFLDLRGHLRSHSQVAAHHTAVDAARRLADRPAQAHAHRTLARAYARLGQLEDAHTHLSSALDLFDQFGDHTGKADTHRNLAYVFERRHQHREALDHVRQARSLYGIAGNHTGQARALNAVGWYLALLGEHQQAIGYCQRALPLLREYGLRRSEAATWDSLGYAHHHLDRHDEAANSYQQALRLYQQLDDRFYEATTLTNLGDSCHAAGDHDAAQETWQRAQAILDELDHPNAEQLHAKLRTLDRPTRTTEVA
jgi:tetratricopeptide (TPR) repeat protein